MFFHDYIDVLVPDDIMTIIQFSHIHVSFSNHKYKRIRLGVIFKIDNTSKMMYKGGERLFGNIRLFNIRRQESY